MAERNQATEDLASHALRLPVDSTSFTSEGQRFDIVVTIPDTTGSDDSFPLSF